MSVQTYRRSSSRIGGPLPAFMNRPSSRPKTTESANHRLRNLSKGRSPRCWSGCSTLFRRLFQDAIGSQERDASEIASPPRASNPTRQVATGDHKVEVFGQAKATRHAELGPAHRHIPDHAWDLLAILQHDGGQAQRLVTLATEPLVGGRGCGAIRLGHWKPRVVRARSVAHNLSQTAFQSVKRVSMRFPGSFPRGERPEGQREVDRSVALTHQNPATGNTATGNPWQRKPKQPSPVATA